MQEMIELKTELDKLMSSLSGVIAARTVLNADDEIVEIHILSDLTKSPKQLVRDIQSAIMAAFGLDIDYKLISVAQVNSNMVVPPISAEPRVTIRKIIISLDAVSVETTVVLCRGDKTFEGSSKSPLSSRNRVSSAASACVNAIKNYLGLSYNITMLDMQRNMVAGNECFVIALSYVEPFSESILYGIAPISSQETEVQSAVMAVLSAINRSISKPKKP
jgi:hypothetical protein